ncbi:Gfo/Idh/MocA family oxidoreductase [Selenomonas sp.]|uniref:Gfo/Idh/MocA family protein n=1 Tax=Selenomonas sp. TaxID=2053611 RepID=UPI0025DA5A22|nr:Gfo/Idh/MocA family oxidoreductase [Selenomonas sp.]MCI6283333.1 Gfo/Idh/MocA family oxidoreductase [Selenomonas sp.]
MKLAILGTGKIVHDLLEALKCVPDIEVTSVFARPKSRAKAEALASDWDIPRVYTDYAELLANDDADFIYVGLINTVHYEYTKQALAAGKNVIVEKPFAPTYVEVKELVDLAQAKHAMLLEAVTLCYLPNFYVMKEAIAQLGTIRAVQANYSQYSSRYDKYRDGVVLPAFDPKLAGGALYDINIYNLNLICGLFGAPERATYTVNRGFNGVDTSGVAVLKYPTFFATAVGAKDSASDGFCIIQGENGWLEMQGAPNELPRVVVHAEGKDCVVEANAYEHRMVHEFQAFARIHATQDFDAVRRSNEQSLHVAKLVDELRA